MGKYSIIFSSMLFTSGYSFADCDGLGRCAAYFTSETNESYTIKADEVSFQSVPAEKINDGRRFISTQAMSIGDSFSKVYTLEPSTNKDKAICLTFISRKQFDPTLYIKYATVSNVWLIQDGGPGETVSINIEGVGPVGIQKNVVYSLGKYADQRCYITWQKN